MLVIIDFSLQAEEISSVLTNQQIYNFQVSKFVFSITANNQSQL